MFVRQMKVGDEQNFVYLLADEPSGEAIAIDSGWEIEPIVAITRAEKLDVKYAVATHHHSDHAATLWQLARLFDAKVVAHRSSPISHDLDVDDGDVLRVGELQARILHTPGHTEDSICVYDGENLFTGDTLLIGCCGRTDMLGGSPKKMYGSLRSLVHGLPPETVVYPGHDQGEVPYRTLSEEVKLNPALSVANYAEFLRVVRSRGSAAGHLPTHH